MHMVQLGGHIGGMPFAVTGVTAVWPGSLSPWLFLAIFAAVASMGGIGFVAIWYRPRRRMESIMGEDRLSPITIPKFDLGDGFLCLLFIAACIWAFVFGGSWFQLFFVGAVVGGLLIAATMYAGRRTVARLLPKSARNKRELH
jgi:hypothetical protein